MAVICRNGTFFNVQLMQHIEQKNNDEVLSILQHVTDPCQLSDSCGNTLLHFAAKYGNNPLVQHLLDLGVAVDIRNLKRQTPLFLAVDGGREETALLLINANADLFMPDFCGQCPLIRAFQVRRYMSTALLRTLTADSLKKNIEYVNSEIFRFYCGLREFVPLKNVDLTRILLENGSPVNAKSRATGDTALHLAAQRFDLEHVKLLLEFNADVDAKGRGYRDTPIARITIKKDEQQGEALAIVKLLVAAGAKLIHHKSQEPIVKNLLSSGSREIVRILLRDRIFLQYISKDRWSVLHALAGNKQPDVLAELPNLKSSVKFRGSWRCTMLHIAVLQRSVNAVKSLLDNGADVDAENRNGETPLDLALSGRHLIHKYDDPFNKLLLGEVLLERGAHPRRIDKTYMFHEMIHSYNCTAVVKEKYEPLLEPVLTHFALREASGEPIDRSSRGNIESYPQCKSTFDSMRRQVDEMKRTKIWQSVTLIDFFHASDRQLLSYSRIQNLILHLTAATKGCNSGSYLHRKLRQRIVKFTRLVKVRTRVVTIINDSFKEFYNASVKNVAENIVDYLTSQELYKISSIFA